MNQLRSQMLGLLLGLATAIGCIFYEKIVKEFSYLWFTIILGIEIILLMIIGYFFFPHNLNQEYQKFISNSKYLWWIIIYISTGITSLCWYIITKKQGVMVGSIYEVKYIAMLALLYIIFGENKFTINTAVGVGLAMISIYFISKS